MTGLPAVIVISKSEYTQKMLWGWVGRERTEEGWNRSHVQTWLIQTIHLHATLTLKRYRINQPWFCFSMLIFFLFCVCFIIFVCFALLSICLFFGTFPFGLHTLVVFNFLGWRLHSLPQQLGCLGVHRVLSQTPISDLLLPSSLLTLLVADSLARSQLTVAMAARPRLPSEVHTRSIVSSIASPIDSSNQWFAALFPTKERKEERVKGWGWEERRGVEVHVRLPDRTEQWSDSAMRGNPFKIEGTERGYSEWQKEEGTDRNNRTEDRQTGYK